MFLRWRDVTDTSLRLALFDRKNWFLHFLGSYIVLIIALILLWANCLSTIITIIITNHHHHFLLERRPKRRLSKEARRVSKEAGEIPVEDGHSSGEQSTARQTTPSQFLGRLSKLSMRKFITVRRCLTCYRRKWTVWLRKLFPIKIYQKIKAPLILCQI